MTYPPEEFFDEITGTWMKNYSPSQEPIFLIIDKKTGTAHGCGKTKAKAMELQLSLGVRSHTSIEEY